MADLPAVPLPAIGFAPPAYACGQVVSHITVDGDLSKPVWQIAPWTEDFVDIEGASMCAQNHCTPRHRTRAKLLWSDTHLYIGAELMEDQIWATLLKQDSVIFQDNDFEIFFDPIGSTHEYGELEINALGTVWDLLLTRPYRDGGTPVDGFDIKGLQVAVKIDGRINDPTAQNLRWCVEAAIPWASIFGDAERSRPPKEGDFWRMNFSRVNWRVEVKDGRYSKVIDPATGRPFPEDNWVWAPIGLVNIHYPELWGYVFFVDDPSRCPPIPPLEPLKWLLRLLYYRQRAYRAKHGFYTTDFDVLRGPELWPVHPIVEVTRDLFQATIILPDGGALSIRQDGYVWHSSQ